MSHARDILDAVDRHLDAATDITLYGRAAFALGFDPPPLGAEASLDVDVVLWLGQAEELQASGNLWDAVLKANAELASSGLYVSHFFEESQVILRPTWRQQRIALSGPWEHLLLSRLADEDLWLSKLMRDDPLDRADARFIAERNRWDRAFLADLASQARVPAIREIEEQFQRCVRHFLSP